MSAGNDQVGALPARDHQEGCADVSSDRMRDGTAGHNAVPGEIGGHVVERLESAALRVGSSTATSPRLRLSAVQARRAQHGARLSSLFPSHHDALSRKRANRIGHDKHWAAAAQQNACGVEGLVRDVRGARRWFSSPQTILRLSLLLKCGDLSLRHSARQKDRSATRRFRQINRHNAVTRHDALEFPDGQVVLLTRLRKGHCDGAAIAGREDTAVHARGRGREANSL
jgi:hypothetical protein